MSYKDDNYNKVLNFARGKLSDIDLRTEIHDKQMDYLSIGGEAFSLKHLGFYEEKEYRVFSFLDQKKPFIINNRKHIKFLFTPEKVKRIVVGPSEKQLENYNAIKDYLSSNSEYSHVELIRSTIPYITSK